MLSRPCETRRVETTAIDVHKLTLVTSQGSRFYKTSIWHVWCENRSGTYRMRTTVLPVMFGIREDSDLHLPDTCIATFRQWVHVSAKHHIFRLRHNMTIAFSFLGWTKRLCVAELWSYELCVEACKHSPTTTCELIQKITSDWNLT